MTEQRRAMPLKEFITAWQTSGSLAEVCEKLGFDGTSKDDRDAMSVKASKLRRRDIPLKYFASRNRQWEELATFAEELLEGQDV